MIQSFGTKVFVQENTFDVVNIKEYLLDIKGSKIIIKWLILESVVSINDEIGVILLNSVIIKNQIEFTFNDFNRFYFHL